MINIYHLLVFLYTRHFTGPIVSCYIISVMFYAAVIILDNAECFPQTNIFMFTGSWLWILSVIGGTAMVGIPIYAIKCWEMVIRAP
jgi:hypothetical protein